MCLKLFLSIQILYIILIKTVYSDSIIRSPRITDWGVWHNWANCPQGSRGTGFWLLVEPYLGRGSPDDTALNQVALECSDFNGKYVSWVQSGEGAWGRWSERSRCPGAAYAAGFQLRSESNQGNGDDTAANNFRMICSDGTVLEGNGLSFGDWTDSQKCPSSQYICGIRSQIEPEVHSADDTALNNIDIRCCDLPKEKPGSDCTARDDWHEVLSYDNRRGLSDITVKERELIGTSKHRQNSQGGHSENGMNASVGTEVSAEIPFVVRTKITASLSRYSKTGISWGRLSSETWRSEKEREITIKIPAGVKSVLNQAIGFCGPYSVKTAHFSRVDTSKNGVIKIDNDVTM